MPNGNEKNETGKPVFNGDNPFMKPSIPERKKNIF